MELSYGVKIGYFLWSLALGAVLCLMYDLIRCGRRLAKPSVFWVNLEDGLFLLLGGILVFWTAFSKNGGNLRLYGILGTALGAGGYYFLFRDNIMEFAVWLSQGLIYCSIKVIRLLLIPVQLVYRILAKPFWVVAWYSRKSAIKTGRILKVKQKRRQLRKKREQMWNEKRKNQSFR